MVNKKFVISGLDNAGKTSILTALAKKYNFVEECKQLQPTVRVAYSRTDFLGNQINFWDMGGQVKYRNQYLKKVEYYFADVDVIYYIIDIQDKNKFDDSFAYFSSIFNYLTHVNHFVPVVVCFHKLDPELRESEDVKSAIEDWQELIAEQFPDWYFLFAETSIFDIRSIVRAMSIGFNLFVKNYEALIALYETFRQQIDAHAVLLYSLGGLIVSEAYADNLTPELQDEVFDRVREDLKDLQNISEEQAHPDSIYRDMGKYKTYLHRVSVIGNDFYIGIFFPSNKENAFNQRFPDFREKTIQMLEAMRPASTPINQPLS
jgi:small GTP-binding protein